MSRKIIGITVGSPLPKPNLEQTDPNKGDYVKGKDIIPTKVSQLENDAKYLTEVPVQSVNGKTGAVQLSASDVGADNIGAATSAVNTHNAKTDAHNDIRLLISALTARLDALANSDDTTLDQMVEVVAYIKENRGLIGQITTDKVGVSDIINNLTTNVGNKPLSAAQGVALKALIDAITIGKLDASALPTAIDTALTQAKASGEFDGKDGTSVTVKSVSESTADGGSNVVTFSDGTTLTVKNGSKGNPGSSESIPSYVVTEAESVIDRVVAAQGSRTFTLAAISDMHYGNNNYKDGIIHACQALKYIDERVKLDAVAVLGDYTDGYPTTNIADAMVDFKAINSMLDKLRFAENLRLMGNHDYYADNVPITRRLIQSYSDGVVWGNRLGGYFHKDFDDYKIRIICPNTNEINPMDTSTNKPSSGLSMTTAQVQWLINTMDMSGKSDAEEWGILILSHHPLDYWTYDYQYLCDHVLDAYKKGSSWSGGGVSCNFSGKNKAKLIGNIHGHIHNLLTDYMFKGGSTGNVKTEVYRSCVPNACYGRENQYDGAWAETTTYTKTQNTADDTAFMVYVINLDKFTVNGICYGAGTDRSFAYDQAPLETYTITNNLTNITTNNDAATIIEGMSFTATLTPAGASITSVTVTMGGANVTSSVYANGVISIPSVTGNIVITAVGEAKAEIINLLDEAGYKNNTRLSSSNGAEKAQTGHVATGYVYLGDVVKGDVIRTSGIDLTYGAYPDQGVFVRCNADKSVAACTYANVAKVGPFQVSLDANGNATLTCVENNTGDYAVHYLRMSGVCADGANAIITKNQIIE